MKMKKALHLQDTQQAEHRQVGKHPIDALPKWLSVTKAARMLDMSTQHLRTMLPEIPGVTRFSPGTTRIPLAGLLAWVKQFETK